MSSILLDRKIEQATETMLVAPKQQQLLTGQKLQAYESCYTTSHNI